MAENVEFVEVEIGDPTDVCCRSNVFVIVETRRDAGIVSYFWNNK
jgi:hypothetical protein